MRIPAPRMVLPKLLLALYLCSGGLTVVMGCERRAKDAGLEPSVGLSREQIASVLSGLEMPFQASKYFDVVQSHRYWPAERYSWTEGVVGDTDEVRRVLERNAADSGWKVTWAPDFGPQQVVGVVNTVSWEPATKERPWRRVTAQWMLYLDAEQRVIGYAFRAAKHK